MTKVFCNIADGLVDPLFEVFDSGDFILSSYHDIEESDTQMQVYLADPAQAGEAGLPILAERSLSPEPQGLLSTVIGISTTGVATHINGSLSTRQIMVRHIR